MKSSVVQFVFFVLVIVVGAALEDMLSLFAVVGLPILLGVSLFAAFAADAPMWILVALGAGAMEEAVASLPPATAIVFFVAVSLMARFFREPLVWAAVTYPAYQVWLGLIIGGPDVFGRFLASIPVGMVALALSFAALLRIWRKAGADA